MFVRIHLVLIAIILMLSACQKSMHPAVSASEWAETKATISVEKVDGKYGYTIQYNAPESTAISKEGKRINGPIQQYGLSQKKPVQGQKLRIKYVKEEPIIFEMIDPMRYAE